MSVKATMFEIRKIVIVPPFDADTFEKVFTEVRTLEQARYSYCEVEWSGEAFGSELTFKYEKKI